MAAERRALLVATDTYADAGLRRLRAPSGDARALGAVLADASVGGFDVRELVNRPTDEVAQEIEGFFDGARRNDLLLLYLSGHGVLSPKRGRLYFATATTRLTHLRATAIADSFVHGVMQDSRARSIVLVLDCCHSGAFAKGLSPKSAVGVGIAQRFKGHGHITLTASDALEYAFEEADPERSVRDFAASPPGSLFTRYLVEGLKTGDADLDQDGHVSIDELYDYILARVASHQTPGKSGASHGDIIVARNPRRALVPPEIRTALEQARSHPWPAFRETAVRELARVRSGADPDLAATVEQTLRGALEDPNPHVRAAARAGLENPAPHLASALVEPSEPQGRDALPALISTLGTLLRDSDADDLQRPLRNIQDRLESERFKLLFVGEFRRGKSTIVNALLGEKVLPAFATPTTATTIEVKWGSRRHAVLYPAAVTDPRPAPRQIPVEELVQHAVIDDDEGNNPYDRIEVFWPLEICRNGVELIDSPGLGDRTTRGTRAYDYLFAVDAVVMVLAADMLASLSEVRFVESVLRPAGHDQLLFVVNRINVIAPDERELVRQAAGRRLSALTTLGQDGIFFVDAKGALEARLAEDAEQLARTGFPEYERRVHHLVTVERSKIKLLAAASALRGLSHRLGGRPIPKACRRDLDVLDAALDRLIAGLASSEHD